MLHFFGLTQEYKIALHKSVFSLVTNGKGGWTWTDVYFNIPVFLRQFYIKELALTLEEEAKASKGTQQTQSGQITPPPFVRNVSKKTK